MRFRSILRLQIREEQTAGSFVLERRTKMESALRTSFARAVQFPHHLHRYGEFVICTTRLVWSTFPTTRETTPLFQHGPLRTSSDKRHFEHDDGTPFFWLGDTWWFGLCKRFGWPEDFKALTADRVKKGFTVVQITSGLNPEATGGGTSPFDPRSMNEAGYAWEMGIPGSIPATGISRTNACST